ncbi:pro-adrenomedullin [Melanotaenia boesemani]|uniref:pro-adrenomedullin n=1 Tax=Melanotaenia boesemani TaxID=1250792 RepID=UPI001C055F34|nr:pro-adrenomedullin [Melanotaenia boesemani]
MRLCLHTVICCCVFTTVLPPVTGATAEPNATLRKRYRVWLQSHVKRDLPNGSVATNVQTSDILDGSLQGAKALPSPPSFGLNVRLKRSSSKQTGCFLATCVYHEMVHRIHESQKVKDCTAPEEKMGKNGYGRRRRRSLADNIQLPVQTGRQGNCSEAGQQVNRHKTHT